jgi:hypothetical protein
VECPYPIPKVRKLDIVVFLGDTKKAKFVQTSGNECRFSGIVRCEHHLARGGHALLTTEIECQGPRENAGSLAGAADVHRIP